MNQRTQKSEGAAALLRGSMLSLMLVAAGLSACEQKSSADKTSAGLAVAATDCCKPIPDDPWTGIGCTIDGLKWTAGKIGAGDFKDAAFYRGEASLMDGRTLIIISGAIAAANGKDGVKKPDDITDVEYGHRIEHCPRNPSMPCDGEIVQLQRGFMHMKTITGPRRAGAVTPWRLILSTRTRAAAAAGTEFIMLELPSNAAGEDRVYRPTQSDPSTSTVVVRGTGSAIKLEHPAPANPKTFSSSKLATASPYDQAAEDFEKDVKRFVAAALASATIPDPVDFCTSTPPDSDAPGGP